MTARTLRRDDTNRSRPRRGAAALELAIILPFAITLVLGCVDFARVIHAQIALANAARVGADYGATHRFTEDTQTDWESTIAETVLEEAGSIPSFSPEEFLLSVDVSETVSGIPDVSVTCQYAFDTVVPWPGLPSAILLRHRTTMRQYQ